jgi:hypothetical protein
MTGFSLMIRCGTWMLTRSGLYRWRAHRALRNPTLVWHQWDRIL